MNFFVKFCFSGLLLLTLGLMTSCSDSDELINVEDYVGEAVFSMESAGKIGRFGCYDFVFPITINFPDETSASVEDYESLREAIGAWKEANPDSEEKPSLTFPLEVTTEDGEVISVADREELGELRRACRRAHHDGKWRRGRGLRNACFDPIFPLTIEFPNGSLLEAATPQTLKNALRAWRRSVDNPEGRPMLVFPITVEYEDGSQVEVESKEALKELKDQCEQGG